MSKVPYNDDNDVSKHFVNGSGKLFEDDNLPELPDHKKEHDKKVKELSEQVGKIKKVIINLSKLKLKETTVDIVKLVGGFLAIVIAMVFVWVFPGAGGEALVVGALAAIFNALGFTTWRVTYGMVKEYYKSKTIVSSIITSVAVLAIVAANFFNFGLPGWILLALQGLVTIFAGTQLYGVFDAIRKANLK